MRRRLILRSRMESQLQKGEKKADFVDKLDEKSDVKDEKQAEFKKKADAKSDAKDEKRLIL